MPEDQPGDALLAACPPPRLAPMGLGYGTGLGVLGHGVHQAFAQNTEREGLPTNEGKSAFSY